MKKLRVPHRRHIPSPDSVPEASPSPSGLTRSPRRPSRASAARAPVFDFSHVPDDVLFTELFALYDALPRTRKAHDREATAACLRCMRTLEAELVSRGH